MTRHLFAGMIALALTAGALPAQTTRTAQESEEQSTTVGGYGEVHYIDPEGTAKGTVDVPRFIIFLEHYFSPQISFFSELEVEHTKVEGNEEGGEVSLEQAYLQYSIDERFNVRAGLLVLPIGIINEYHEPSTFNGVLRPQFDQSLIPTTWREIGFGFVGRIPEIEGLQYRAYVTTGLNSEKFNGSSGIRDGRQEGAQASLHNLALSTRLEYVTGGLRTGGWVYYGGSSFGSPLLGDGLFDAPVLMAGLDAQYTIENLYLRGIIATASITDAALINRGADSGFAGNPDPIGSGMGGGYIEAAYDVLKLIDRTTSHQLLPFVRYEHFNTQASVPDGVTASKANDRTFITFGLTYKPIYNAVVKLDWTAADDATDAKLPGQFALGIGYNF